MFKKILLILLLLPSLCFAGAFEMDEAVIARKNAGGPSLFCAEDSSCTAASGNDADRGCFSFPVAGGCTLTSAVAGTNTITHQAISGSDPCAETGRESHIVFSDTANHGYEYYDTGGNHTTTYGTGYVKVTADNMTATAHQVELISGDDATAANSPHWVVYVVYATETTYKLRLKYFDAGAGWDNDALTATTFNVNTWASFDFKIVPGAVGQIQVNGGGYASGTDNVGNRIDRYKILGSTSGSSYTMTAQIAYLKFDDDTLPTGCTP